MIIAEESPDLSSWPAFEPGSMNFPVLGNICIWLRNEDFQLWGFALVALCKGIGVAKGIRERCVGNPELQLMLQEKCYGLNFQFAPQPHLGAWLPAPCKLLRSQLTVAINTHGALSHGEHYHTTELQIPNLGSQAPWLSAHWGRGGSLKQDWFGALRTRCVGHPALQLRAHGEHDQQHGWDTLFQHPHSLAVTLTHNEPPPDLFFPLHCLKHMSTLNPKLLPSLPCLCGKTEL